MSDTRKEYIISCVLSVLRISRNEFRSNAASNKALDTFLDDPNSRVLQAIQNVAQGGVDLTIGFSPDYLKEEAEKA